MTLTEILRASLLIKGATWRTPPTQLKHLGENEITKETVHADLSLLIQEKMIH